MPVGKPLPVHSSVKNAYDLTDQVVVVTGGAGLLGRKHISAAAEMGAHIVLLDLNTEHTQELKEQLARDYNTELLAIACDITSEKAVQDAVHTTIDHFNRIDVLINNAANNPKIEKRADCNFSRLEHFPLDVWQKDLNVTLTGAFLCSRSFGKHMADTGRGVILNIASDLAIIAPDQRLYREEGLDRDKQPVKPITYSVAKAGLVGLTKYLATYWADCGVRTNALLPGGVYAGQDDAFVERLSSLIPMGRMAHEDEYKGAIAFLISDASSYMNGATLSMDGGRTCW